MCMVCTRYRADTPGFECEAFADGIPMGIILGEIDHRRPVDGDHGLQFEPKNAEATEYVAMVYGKEPAKLP